MRAIERKISGGKEGIVFCGCGYVVEGGLKLRVWGGRVAGTGRCGDIIYLLWLFLCCWFFSDGMDFVSVEW